MSHTYTWTQPEIVAYAYGSPNMAPPNALRPNGNHAHQAAIPISSYSSLAGALDDNTLTTYPRSQSTFQPKTKPSSSYPYPVSHHDQAQQGRSRLNSQTHQERNITSSIRSPRKPQGEEPIFYAPLTKIPREPRPSGPTNHLLVPQQEFREPESKRPYTDPYFRHPPINFQTANIPELGVRVGKITEKYSPSVVGGQDMVMAGVHEKEIRFWIMWPGYSAEPVQKRMKTHNGTISRDTVLMVLANALLEFTQLVQKKQFPIKRGYEDWTIGVRPDNRIGIIGSHLFITRLLHRGGSNWQPEIWAPKKI